MRAIQLSLIFTLSIAIGLYGTPPPETKEKVAKTIVRVKSGNKYSTGFFWRDGRSVVTTLHSLSSTNNIEVFIPAIDDWRPAAISKVYKEADLILLRVSNYTSPNFLSTRFTTRPSVNTRSFTIGYNSGNIAYQDRDFTVGLLQGNTLRDLLPVAAEQEITSLGFPILSTEIVNLNGNLLHGFSGAPVVDYEGRLIGVADGGLENGAAGVSWCIFANSIERLENSTQPIPVLNITVINTLFAAEEYESKDLEDEYFEVGEFRLRKVKSRTFAQMDLTGKYSSSDALGLSQLLNLFSGFNYNAFLYDIYVEEHSGATIVLPSGTEIEEQGEMIVGRTPNVEVFITMTRTDNVQQTSVQFEWAIMPNYATQWVPDAMWSFPHPYPGPNNSAIRRRAYFGSMNRYYLFEALAVRGNYFLGVAAKRDNSFNQFVDYERWAKFAIGIQLSSFTN